MNDAVTLKLIEFGFDQKDISMTMKDVQRRLRWTLNSECFIFSRSTKQWTVGLVVKVTVNETTNVEWLTVQYGTKKKVIQRFSDCIKSKGLKDEYAVNGKLLQLMAEEMRKESGPNPIEQPPRSEKAQNDALKPQSQSAESKESDPTPQSKGNHPEAV